MFFNFLPKKNNICAVVVSHNPGEDFILNIKSVISQVDRVFVVNNGSEKFTPLEITKTEEKQGENKSLTGFKSGFLERAELGDKIYLINNSENLGQGKALNQGVGWAISKGYQWVLLLDQDSLLESSMIQELIQAYQSYQDGEKVKMIGSNCAYRNIQEVKYKKDCQGKLYFVRDVVMMSGSLLAASVYREVGPFREEFFIDSIDADYCLRLRKKGYKIIVAYKAKMTHTVGEGAKMRRFLWRRFLVTNHSPIRCYYMTRNGLILVKEYFFREPHWVLRRIVWYFLIKPGLVVFFEKNKLNKIKFMFIGATHALINKTGIFEK